MIPDLPSCRDCAWFAPNGKGVWECAQPHWGGAASHKAPGYASCKGRHRGTRYYEFDANKREQWETACKGVR